MPVATQQTQNFMRPVFSGGGPIAQAQSWENQQWNQHQNNLAAQSRGQQQQAANYRQGLLANMPLSNPRLQAAYPQSNSGSTSPSPSGNGSTTSGGAYGTSGSGNANIQTSIQPTPVYSPQQTQMATNQAIAGQQQNNSLEYLMRALRRPGQAMSSPGLLSAALPQYAMGQSRVNEAAGMIPFEDAQTNASAMLAGQTGRENEALGWGRLQSTLNNAQQSMTVDTILNLLRQFTG